MLHLNNAVLCEGKARGHLQPSLKWFHGPQDRMLDIAVMMMFIISYKDIFFTAERQSSLLLLIYMYFLEQKYHQCMAGLLVPPYGAMESVSNADSKSSLVIFRL